MANTDFFTPDSNNSGTLQGNILSQPNFTIPEGKTFTDRLDNTFKKVLKGIGFMYLVVNDINKKQDRAIELLEIGISANKSVGNKVDKLQETLEEMIDGRLRDKDEEDRRRREEDLEKVREAISESSSLDPKDTEVPDFFTSSLPKLALGIGVAALLANHREEIAAFLGFIRSTSSVLGYLGGTASGALSSTRLINPGMVSGFSSAMKTVGGPAINAAKPSIALLSVLKWLRWLQKAAWFLVLLDPLITMGQAYLFGTNGESFKRVMAKSFGRVAGGYLGAIWIGKLGALLGAAIGSVMVPGAGTVVGGVVGLVCGAIAGGYYGVEIGELFGAALYDLLASDMKDWSGFTKIWDKISSDIQSGLESAVAVVGGTIDSGLNALGLGSNDPATPSTLSKPPLPFNSRLPTSPLPSTLPSVNKGSSDVDAMHRAVSAQTGMSLNEMRAIGQIESGNKHDPSVQTGSYQGLYQLDKKGDGDEFDPDVQVSRMTANIKSYKQFFKKYVGREPTAAEIYLLHQQGPTGGTSLVLAYYGGDKSMKAAEGIVKWAQKGIGITLSVLTIRNHIYTNIGWSRTHKVLMEKGYKLGVPKSKKNVLIRQWISENISVEEMYVSFIVGVNDRIAAFDAKDKEGSEKPSITTPPANMNDIKQNINFKPGPDVDTYEAESGTYAMAAMLTEEGLISNRVTGVKDQFHMDRYGPNNSHNKGLAFDFTIAEGSNSSTVVQRIKEIAREAGVSVIVKDFYTDRSKGFKPHIHVEFQSKTDADKFMSYYNNRQKTMSPVPRTPNSGENLIAMGSPNDKPKVIIMPQQKQAGSPTLNMPMPQSRPGVSGSPPAAYNYNIPAFLNGIT